MQLFFVTLLDADLADIVRAAVIGSQIGCLELLEILVVDASYIADQMCSLVFVGILTEQARLDFHTGKAKALGGEAGNFNFTQATAYRVAVGGMRFGEQFLEALAILGLNIYQGSQFIDCGFEIAHLGGRDFQRVAGIILCQNHAVAILNQAAIGYDGYNRNAVVVGQGGKIVLFDQLQMYQAGNQQ